MRHRLHCCYASPALALLGSWPHVRAHPRTLRALPLRNPQVRRPLSSPKSRIRCTPYTGSIHSNGLVKNAGCNVVFYSDASTYAHIDAGCSRQEYLHGIAFTHIGKSEQEAIFEHVRQRNPLIFAPETAA